MWEEFGEGKKFWQTVQRLRKGKQILIHMVFDVGRELLISNEAIVRR